VWEGTDILTSREVIEVGPEGEKVDVMTFRGSFERDVKEFAEADADMGAAIAEEDDGKLRILRWRLPMERAKRATPVPVLKAA